MRRHVMMTLLDTEQSYVESLRSLIQVIRTVPPKTLLEFLQKQTGTDATQAKIKFESI